MSPRVRSAFLLSLVVLLLVAGYLLQKVEDAGSDQPEVPSSELTPDPGSTPDATSAATAGRTTVAPTPLTASKSPPPTAGRDLSADESAGGHTLARHVGRSDADLRARLKAEPDISAASTYTDRATAERVVAEVLEKKQSEVEKWAARQGDRSNLVLRFDIGETIGRSIEQGKSSATEVQNALVVLRWTGSRWYVLTSYPEDR